MRRPALGSAVFFLLAPGVVAGVLPWWISGWPAPRFPPAFVLLAAAVVVLLRAFVRFVREGRGTPAPVAPTERLVVSGEYRYVRNPMYVAVVATVLGQALLFLDPGLVVYALGAWALMASFVRWHEEPTLRRRYGREYEEYCRTVPAWLPRMPARR